MGRAMLDAAPVPAVSAPERCRVHTTVFWALKAPEEASGENLFSVTVAIDR
jgi:hypothetical protein